ncbi:MAG TPA: hypothetical protein PLW66_10370 [Saprospiraceae bacterium]|nr:hypothetical protein [Saprospiraceae bacterium]
MAALAQENSKEGYFKHSSANKKCGAWRQVSFSGKPAISTPHYKISD